MIDLEHLDAASRGPWGSFLMLRRAHKDYLAIVGALITIAAVAIDPFSQQVIHYRSYQRVDPDNAARVSMTNKYTYSGPGALIAPGDPRELEGVMTAAIYEGLVDPPPNATALILVQCSELYVSK